MGQMEALIPAWVAPTAREVADCHWIAHAVADEVGRASVHGEVCSILDWVTGNLPDEAEVRTRLRDAGAAANTVAWLLGITGIPPIALPRRNLDGTLLTHEQLVTEYMADKWDGPEERLAAARWASQQAARNSRLASLVPH
jgi:hypothetical protein